MAEDNSSSLSNSGPADGQIAPEQREPAETAERSPLHQVAAAALALKQQGDSGANWFYWVAALSLVNTIIAHSGGDRHFIVGLSFTAIVDAIAQEVGKQEPDTATIATAIAIGFSCFVTLVAVLFGWLSRKRWLAMFGVGMAIYVLDGLLYLLLGDILSAGFHGYALWSMASGFRAYRKLSKLEEMIRAAHDQLGDASAIDDSSDKQ
jgi:hypothetical protein